MNLLRKLLIVSVISLFVISLNAQTSAGKILVGSASSFSFDSYTRKYKSDNGDNTLGKGIIFSLAPNVGYFVIDGLAVGMQFDLSIDSYKPEGSSNRTTTTVIKPAPFAKYYYGTSQLRPFAEAAFGLGVRKNRVPSIGGTTTSGTGLVDLGLKVGAAYFLNDNVAAELGLGYDYSSSKDKEDNEGNVRNVTSKVGIEFGISIIL